MTRAVGRLGPYRLALRIYLATVAAVVATGFALVAIVRVAVEPPRHDGDPASAWMRYVAGELADQWDDPAALRARVERLAAGPRAAATVYRADGTLVASAQARPAAAPSEAERRAIAETGLVERGRREPDRGGPDGPPPAREVVLPVARGGAVVGYAVLVQEDPRFRRHPPAPWMLPLALILLGLGVAAALLGSSIARPLDRLAQTAHALGSGDLAARTGMQRRDELGAVARAFDEMADRVEKLLRAQTELIANVAHELRTPLARIRVALDLADDGDAEVARDSLREIGEDLGELEQLVNDILASARMELARNKTSATGAPPLHRATLEIGEVVQGAAERLRHRYPDRPLEVEIPAGLPPVEGDALLLRRALDNLLDNARKYSARGAPIRLRAAADGDGVVVQVIDRGEGIAPADVARLFTPFFRADPSRNRATGGVGLGLALARRIVEAHGGTLVAESVRGEGTTMTVRLPARAAAAPARASR